MNLHKLCAANYMISAAQMHGVALSVLPSEAGAKYIKRVFEKFNPWRREGHLQLGDRAKKISTDENEMSFSLNLPAGVGCDFFEQNAINKNVVVCFEDVRSLSAVLENCPGMEYFISDELITYMVAVNWYTIECLGDVDLCSSG